MRRGLILVGGLLIVMAAAAAAHDALTYAAVRAVASLMGYSARAATFHVTFGSLSAGDLSIENHAGEPVFGAARAHVDFSLRDLLPGSKHRFGLQALDLGRPTLTLIHHADGSYNVPLPNLANPNARPDETPLDLRVRIRDGSVVLIDRFIVPGAERRERIEGLHFDAVFSRAKHSYYDAGFALNDGSTAYPVWGRAIFSTAHGFASQHWHADLLPIGPLFDFALNAHGLDLADGRLVDLDARIYNITNPSGASAGMISATAHLQNGKLYAAQLAKPIRDANGPLHLFNDGIDTAGLSARLAGVPLHLVGGIYNAAAPNVRFFLTGEGDLSRLRQIATTAQAQEVRGRLAFSLFIEGSLAQPLVFARLSSPVIAYRSLSFTGLRGFIAFSGTRLDILSSSVGYGPALAAARGSVKLEKQVAVELVGDVRAPSSELPYVAQLAPGQRLEATAVVQGIDRRLATDGIIFGSGTGGRLSAPFAIDETGTGFIGPLALTRSDGGRIASALLLDRPDDVVLASLDVTRLHLSGASVPALPGISLPAMPALAGTLDAHATAMIRASRIALANAHLDLREGGETVADLQGSASSQGDTSGLSGRLRGSLATIGQLAGLSGATGTVDARFAALHRGAGTMLQIVDARFARARVGGVPIQRARATVEMRGNVIAVDAALVEAAGGNATLHGRFGGNGSLSLTARGIDLAALGDLALPLRKGRVDGLARVGGTRDAPTAHVGVLLARGAYGALPLDGQAEVSYRGDRLGVNDASMTLAGAYASASGEVRGLRPGHLAPRVALKAHARAIDVASLASALGAHLRYPTEGSLDADLRVHGPVSTPRVDGTISAPEGSVNGLAFTNAAAQISGSASSMSARNGEVTVGTSHLAFDGTVGSTSQSIALRAPHVNLADFDNFFDPGDMLGGRGSLTLSGVRNGNALHVDGDARVSNARFRRFALGNIQLDVDAVPGAEETHLSLTGAHGSLQGAARVALAAPYQVVGGAQLTELDLATWLPAAGLSLPVFGKVDATATLSGHLRTPTMAIAASLHDGFAGRIPVNRLTLNASTDGYHIHLAQAELDVPSLQVTAQGVTGVTPDEPFDLALQANSPDVGALAKLVTGKPVDGAGTFDARVRATGTRTRPLLVAEATVQKLRVRKLIVPRIVADASLDAQTLSLNRAEIDLTQGVAQISARVPIVLAARRLAGPRAPVVASVKATRIDLAQFAPAFAENTKVGGLIDGQLGVAGTLGSPSLSGHLALSNGSYSSSLIISPLTHVTLALDLFGTQLRLSQVHLESGGGSLDGSGVASAPDLRHGVQTLSLQANATASHLRIVAPRYFVGTVDGTVAVARTPGNPPLVSGTLAFSSTRVPLTALLPPAPAAQATSLPFNVAFDLAVAARNDVRVQGANVDIGARGRVHVGGTLAAPALQGRFASTGGSISFYRTFAIQNGTVAFSPDSGVIPYVDATATTHVTDPDTDILLHATGPATHLNLDFASNPSYSREQIVGLLANVQALGALGGVSGSGSSGQPSLLQSTAFGYVDDQFTRALLEPLQSNLAQSLGLQNLQLQAGLTGEFGANATAKLGRRLTASFAQSYGTTQRQTIGLNERFNSATSLQLSLFSATGAAQLVASGGLLVDPTQPTDLALLTLVPPAGTRGATLSYQHHF